MILTSAGLAGFAVLTLEVLGVHWLAPWFGASALVWSNQIGVVLLAMALGGWLGGARARRSADPLRLAGSLMAGGGVLVGIAIPALPAFARWLLPAGLQLDEAAVFFLGGSLGAALLFLAPPVLLLAMVAPLLVEARAVARGAGRAAGEVTAAGTLGSLGGVFGSSLLAIPLVGVRSTLAGVAALLILAGLLLRRRGRNRGTPLVALLALLPVVLPDPADTANLPLDDHDRPARVVATAESPYQRLRVVEFPGGDRWLQMNEGLDSYQAVWRPGTLWPGGYYDLFVLASLYALDGVDRDAPVSFWVLGWGAGSVLGPVVAGLGGRPWQAVGVEIDPAVLALAREHMPLPREAESHLHLVGGGDARGLLRAAPSDLDLLVVDTYARQFEIPLHMATVEFFEEAASHLRPGGVLAVNVGTAVAPDGQDLVVGPLMAGLARAFGPALRAQRVAGSRNTVLFARKGEPLPPLERLPALLPAGVPLGVGTACLPSQVRDGPPAAGIRPFGDQRNPLALAQALEWLRGGRE